MTESSLVPPEVIHISDALSRAPLWRREPFRVFFPLGMFLAWLGVGHWLLHALGVLDDYRPVFHAMTQIQGFLMCFAVGFLFTMLPRRTGSAPPEAWQMIVCIAAPVATVAAAWSQHWALAQAAWLVMALTLIGFAVARFVSASSRRRPPNSFVWIPAALAMGIAGSLLTGAYGALGPEYAWLHVLGRNLVLQGMFTGLVVGVGGLALPLMTRGQAPPDGASTPRDHAARAAHLLGAVLLALSFLVEARVSLAGGLLLRALVVLWALLFGAELWRAPTQPGSNRRLLWLAAWMLPVGYALAAASPAHYKAGLHVVFLGGFALLAMAVSTQVVLGHGGHRDEMLGRPWQVLAIGALMGTAMVARALVEFDRARFFIWLAVAAALFLAASGVWMAFLLPKMIASGDRPRRV